jgi:hypothetical protein
MVKQRFINVSLACASTRLLKKINATLLLFCLLHLTASGQGERTRYFPVTVEYVSDIPHRKNVWIFILAGQSNMAGRGIVGPQDTLSNARIMTIDKAGRIIRAKEPLHFYEPQLTGLDCGLSFGKKLISEIDSSITLLLIPTAVGGSSTHQWLGDSLHRNVKLQTNFREKVSLVKKAGTIKGILWHQGESDAESSLIPGYEQRLVQLFRKLREYTGNPDLPIFIGELGSYSSTQADWDLINRAIHHYKTTDKNAFVIQTGDLNCKDDQVHFDSEAQRQMGERFARKVLEVINK